jgi:hypothetical protein
MSDASFYCADSGENPAPENEIAGARPAILKDAVGILLRMP